MKNYLVKHCKQWKASILNEMLDVNKVKKGDIIIVDGKPYRVLDIAHMKKARQGATINMKLKNLTTNNTLSHTVNSSERFEEANIEKKEILFIYGHRGEYVFSDLNDRSNRFSIKEEDLIYEKDFLKQGMSVTAEYFDGNLIGIDIPIKVDYKVIDAPPGVKGNTVSGGTKMVTIETGAKIQTPLFIEEGDIIRVNTEKGEYVERAK